MSLRRRVARTLRRIAQRIDGGPDISFPGCTVVNIAPGKMLVKDQRTGVALLQITDHHTKEHA